MSVDLADLTSTDLSEAVVRGVRAWGASKPGVMFAPDPSPGRQRHIEPGAYDTIVANRHSAPDFAPTPVPLGLVESIIAVAAASDSQIWPEAGGISLIAAVRAPDNHGRHVYQWTEDRLEDSGRSVTAQWDRISFQENVAGAPVILFAVGAVVTACRDSGLHGYRSLLVRAGAILQTAWLEASRSGLAARPFRSCYGQWARDVIGTPSADSRLLVSLALGQPLKVGRREQEPDPGGV